MRQHCQKSFVNLLNFMQNADVLDIISKKKDSHVVVIDGKEKLELSCKNVVVAPGRTGAKWVQELADKYNIAYTSQSIEIGVRVEVRKEILEDITNIIYDPTIFIKTDTYTDEIRTFCTNPGGYVTKENYYALKFKLMQHEAPIHYHEYYKNFEEEEQRYYFFNGVCYRDWNWQLYMRTPDDKRPDYEIKKEISYVPFDVFGGTENCERLMIRFGSEELFGYEEPFPICCLLAEPLIEKFADNFTHRDFLGAIMNLGIERDVM